MKENESGKLLAELASVFNRYNMENISDTPDYVLAQLTLDFLNAYANGVRRRDEFFGFKPWGGNTVK